MKRAENILKSLEKSKIGAMDFLPDGDLVEKMISLALNGPPSCPTKIKSEISELYQTITKFDCTNLQVVVFGGGTGLSNVIGGDSRTSFWPRDPFHGMKELFPKTRSIVCVTDDGGSTGELLKELPLIALGDLRHVLLSSIQLKNLMVNYGLAGDRAKDVAQILHSIFNYRFSERLASVEELLEKTTGDFESLPLLLKKKIRSALDFLFSDERLLSQLDRPNCLGNLIIAASIYQSIKSGRQNPGTENIVHGIENLGEILGAGEYSVLPCTTTPANLKVLYENGVLVTGEHKSAYANRGYPVDKIFVGFVSDPVVPKVVLDSIKKADIIVFAPGSLYTSIIPILQVPGVAEVVRNNKKALKLLVANLWIQKGETDIVREDPRRRFYVSDLIKAYHRNIPGGVHGLFKNILALRLEDIPGNVLQNYAVEGKLPIYLDKGRVSEMGFVPIESGIFSQSALEERAVMQHDPGSLALSIQAIWGFRKYLHDVDKPKLPVEPVEVNQVMVGSILSCKRFAEARKWIDKKIDNKEIREAVTEIVWKHQDILIEHLDYVKGVSLIAQDRWNRSQRWDKIYSFYDPQDGLIKIRKDIFLARDSFELAFLVALGQSLLGNYAESKNMLPIEIEGEELGSVYELIVRKPGERHCYLKPEELDNFLHLARMKKSEKSDFRYTRLVSGKEGFTPPGLLFGLTYAWYLDNRLAAHIEYKMAIIRTEVSELVPEQIRMLKRRQEIVDFFREVVFRYKI